VGGGKKKTSTLPGLSKSRHGGDARKLNRVNHGEKKNGEKNSKRTPRGREGVLQTGKGKTSTSEKKKRGKNQKVHDHEDFVGKKNEEGSERNVHRVMSRKYCKSKKRSDYCG